MNLNRADLADDLATVAVVLFVIVSLYRCQP